MSSVLDLAVRCKVPFVDGQLRDGDVLTELPNGEVVFYNDASHRYFLLQEDGTKRTLYAVTSVLKVLDKPGLLSWVRDVTLEGKKYWEERDKAGTRGDSIHKAAEALAQTGRSPFLKDFPEEDRGYVQALAGWWLKTRPKVIATEVIVASLEYGFAGRFDLLCEINGKRCLRDYKTSKRVYPVEHFAQLEAYEGAGVECGYQPTDSRAVVRLGEDGSFEEAESCASFGDFLAIKAVFDCQKRIEGDHKLAVAA